MNPSDSRVPDAPSVIPAATANEIAAAEFYQRYLVPGLFAERVSHILAAARIEPGMQVLDVACGTGELTRAVAETLKTGTRPVGVDIAPAMLTVASRADADIEWRHGDAAELPFEAATFDCLLCQFGLMFCADLARTLAEMRRVLRPGGRLALTVWDSLERNPGSARLHEILARLAGSDAARALEVPFRLGDSNALRAYLEAAGFSDIEIDTVPGQACYPSLELLIDAEIRGWLPIMGVRLDDTVVAAIAAECRRQFRADMHPDGRLAMPTSAHVFGARRPAGRED